MVKKTLLFFSLIWILIGVSPSLITASIEPLTTWSQDRQLPYYIASHTSVNSSGNLVVIAGSALTYNSHDDVIFSLSDISGNLGEWNFSTSKYPQKMIWHTAARKVSNYLYGLGGYEEYSGSSHFSDNYVYFAHEAPSPVWTSTTPLPQRLSKGGAVVSGDYIYFSGGWTDIEGPGTASRKVYYSHINTDGTLGTWGEATDLPDVWWDHKMVEHNGSIYVVGGWNSGGVTNRVLRARTNPDGSIGAWEDMPSLPQPARAAGVTRAGDYVFVVGGYSGSDFLNTVYYTTIAADGQMAAWQTSSNSLPAQHCCGALAEVGGFLYLTGGFSAADGYTDKVYRSQLLIPLPSPTPTPTPTPTPSPLPALEVIDLKQYSPPWGSMIYDNASVWSTNPTVARWGCALTSATMVLKYQGHTETDPEILNTWLVSQPDGYIRNGLVNWLAISRYTRLHDGPDSPTLEYRRLGTNTADLVAELTANRPAILQEPGHFIVAKSQLPDTFGINDPAYADRPTLSSYANTYLSLGSFRPTHTDLSYILLVVDPDITMEMVDPSGNQITGASYTDNPLVDDVDGTQTSGEPVNIFLFPTPPEGTYDVKLTGPAGTYALDSYLYNDQGDVLKSTYFGLNSPGEEDHINLTMGDNPQSSPQVTIDTTIQDLKDARDQGLIKSRQIYELLRRDLFRIKKLLEKGKTKAAKTLLHVTSRLIKMWSPRFIDPTAAQVLKGDVEILYQSL